MRHIDHYHWKLPLSSLLEDKSSFYESSSYEDAHHVLKSHQFTCWDQSTTEEYWIHPSGCLLRLEKDVSLEHPQMVKNIRLWVQGELDYQSQLPKAEFVFSFIKLRKGKVEQESVSQTIFFENLKAGYHLETHIEIGFTETLSIIQSQMDLVPLERWEFLELKHSCYWHSLAQKIKQSPDPFLNIGKLGGVQSFRQALSGSIKEKTDCKVPTSKMLLDWEKSFSDTSKAFKDEHTSSLMLGSFFVAQTWVKPDGQIWDKVEDFFKHSSSAYIKKCLDEENQNLLTFFTQMCSHIVQYNDLPHEEKMVRMDRLLEIIENKVPAQEWNIVFEQGQCQYTLLDSLFQHLQWLSISDAPAVMGALELYEKMLIKKGIQFEQICDNIINGIDQNTKELGLTEHGLFNQMKDLYKSKQVEFVLQSNTVSQSLMRRISRL